VKAAKSARSSTTRLSLIDLAFATGMVLGDSRVVLNTKASTSNRSSMFGQP